MYISKNITSVNKIILNVRKIRNNINIYEKEG